MSDDDFDLIVVGAGTAGIPCALEAAKAGGRVLLLDKADKVGGTLHVSSGHMSAAGSRLQRSKGIVDSPDDHFADIMRISEATGRAEMARVAVDSVAATIDWLEENGFDFSPDVPRIVYGHEPYTTARTYHGVDGGRSVLAVLRRLLDEALKGGRIDLRLSTSVASLIIEHDRCVGVRLADGSSARAPSVVLATGGFAANPELFERLEGVKLVSAAYETSTGDGLNMAVAAGAAVAGRGKFLPTFGGLPAAQGVVRIPFDDRPRLVAQERPPHEIYVDRNGARWVAEDDPSIDRKERALLTLPDLTFWMVFDAAGLRESSPVVKGWDPAEMDRRANVQPGVHSADTLDELAARAGISAPGLAEAVACYNQSVAAGVDEAFGRQYLPAPITEAPFYALENHGITLTSRAGVDVDTQLRVRRADGSVIEGLYAAGEIIGSAAIGGNSFCSGMSVTPSITFGRMLGKRLAMAALREPA